MKNIICIHHNDDDGRGAASEVALFEKLNRKSNFFEADYSSEMPYDMINKDTKVYIVDYSFTEKTLYKLKKIMHITKNVIWIDHHKSSLDLLKEHPELNNIRGLRVNGISGMGLTHMYLYNKKELSECPPHVQLVSDYDTFKFVFGDSTKHFILGLDSCNTDPLSTVWKSLTNTNFMEELIEKGKIVQKYNEATNELLVRQTAFATEIKGYSCLAVNKKGNSIVFGKLINDFDIVCCYYYNGKEYFYSIFTNKNNIDCKSIASYYNGGGHVKAAGFQLKYNLFE